MSFLSNAVTSTDEYQCAVVKNKVACARLAAEAAGGGFLGDQAVTCATAGDTDGCAKVILSLAAQEACVYTGPAALACVYLTPVIVGEIYPYLKSLLTAMIYDVPGDFFAAIGVDLSGLVAHGEFDAGEYIAVMAPAIVAHWTNAVAGVDAAWHAARAHAGLSDAPFALDASLVAANVARKNADVLGESIVEGTGPLPLHGGSVAGVPTGGLASAVAIADGASLSAREALLAWLYAYAEGWSKSKVTTQSSEDLNGTAQVWTANQAVPALQGEPETAPAGVGPLGLQTGGFPSNCNQSCVTSLAFGASACWRYRLDALAAATVAMMQVIAQQTVREKAQPTLLGNAVRVAAVGAAGYGVYRGLMWLLPRLLGA
jgi:hypothetical protein